MAELSRSGAAHLEKRHSIGDNRQHLPHIRPRVQGSPSISRHHFTSTSSARVPPLKPPKQHLQPWISSSILPPVLGMVTPTMDRPLRTTAQYHRSTNRADPTPKNGQAPTTTQSSSTSLTMHTIHRIRVYPSSLRQQPTTLV